MGKSEGCAPLKLLPGGLLRPTSSLPLLRGCTGQQQMAMRTCGLDSRLSWQAFACVCVTSVSSLADSLLLPVVACMHTLAGLCGRQGACAPRRRLLQGCAGGCLLAAHLWPVCCVWEALLPGPAWGAACLPSPASCQSDLAPSCCTAAERTGELGSKA